jgi:hypothetical protein
MARTLLFLSHPELAGGIPEARTRAFRVVVEHISMEDGTVTAREWYYMSFAKARRVYRTLAKELMVSRDTASYRVCLNRAVTQRWDDSLFFAAEDRARSASA